MVGEDGTEARFVFDTITADHDTALGFVVLRVDFTVFDAANDVDGALMNLHFT